MITKTHATGFNDPEFFVSLKYASSLEDIEQLKASLLFCIKTIALSKDTSGEIPELWDICTLIEDLSLSNEQIKKADKILFP